MHTLFSVHFPNGRIITLDVAPEAVVYEDDLIVVGDMNGGHWNFERSQVMYSMQSDVSDEEFERLASEAEAEAETPEEPSPPRRTQRRLR